NSSGYSFILEQQENGTQAKSSYTSNLSLKNKKRREDYYAFLSQKYGVSFFQSDARGDRATSHRTTIGKKETRPVIIINEKDYRCNELHLAVLNNSADCVERAMLADNTYVEGQDNYGNTPLHFAVCKGKLKALKAFMSCIEKHDQNQKEGYVKRENDQGETPLHLAARSGNAEVVSELLDLVGEKGREDYVKSKSNQGETLLHFAVRSGSTGVVEKLLEYVNDKEGYVKIKNINQCTPLHFAAESGNVEIVNKLLNLVGEERREDYVESKSKKGDTPLHFASKGRKSNVKIIRSLIRCVTQGQEQKHVTRKNSAGYTPLHFAARNGEVKVVEKLLEYVTDKEDYVKSKNNKDETALHFAARSGEVKVVEKLLEYVTDKEDYVKSKNNKDETALHFAARNGEVKVVEKLLEYVTDKEDYVKSKNNKDETALHFAARSGEVKVVEKLLEYVTDKEDYVKSKNNKDETALHFAARSGNVKAVEKLLQFVRENEKENYIEFANNDNRKALEVAISYGNSEVFSELLKYIENPKQKQHYSDLAEQASDSEKRNIHSSDNLQTKGCVKERKKQRNSEGPTSSYSKKRPRISDGNTQKPPVKKDKTYKQDDSSREGYSRSNRPTSQNGINPLEQESSSDLPEPLGFEPQDSEKKIKFYEEAKKLNPRNDGILTSLGAAKKNLGDKAQDLEKKIKFYEEGKEFDSQNTNIIECIAHMSSELGDIYCSINDKAKGAECYKKAIECYKKVRELCDQGIFIGYIARVSNKLGDIIEDEKAKYKYYEQAMEYYEMGISPFCIDSLNNAVSISMKLSNITKCMNKQNEWREISEKYSKMVNESKILEDLRLACNSQSRNWNAIKIFIDQIDNVNKSFNSEDSLLHLAATNGQRKMVKYLLEKGANVTFGSKGERTPLHNAAEKGHLDIVKMLLKKNATYDFINYENNLGRTALHLAAQEGHPDVVKMLLKKGARSFVDRSGNTPFWLVLKRLSQDRENNCLKEVKEYLLYYRGNSDGSSSDDISERSSGDEESDGLNNVQPDLNKNIVEKTTPPCSTSDLHSSSGPSTSLRDTVADIPRRSLSPN
ncbi:MAG: ankyrin repeat domain-containing protein, partial [Wolbachia pipientis]